MRFKTKLSWRTHLGMLLILASAVLYIVNFELFHDSHDLFFYLSIDTAFVPIEVLLVVLVIETAINEKEKKIILEKLNMVIGTFFSEVGTQLLKNISEFDSKSGKINRTLIVKDDWSEKDFIEAKNCIKNQTYKLNINGNDSSSVMFLKDTCSFLKDKRIFLVTLLENPNLLEHETFTELLWAVFHLADELEKRDDVTQLPEPDYEHLKLDTERAYNLLIYEWLEYMEHLRENFPYLFSLALRTNPFDPDASVEIPG